MINMILLLLLNNININNNSNREQREENLAVGELLATGDLRTRA